MALVEADRGDLRIEPHLRPAALSGLVHQRQQQCIADATATPRRAHRHPADVVIRGQAGGADRGAVQHTGKHVHAQRIQRIVLQLDRHALFADEDLVAHAAQFAERVVEIHQLHPERLQCGIIAAHASSCRSSR